MGEIKFRKASILPEILVSSVILILSVIAFMLFFSTNLLIESRFVKGKEAFLTVKSLSNYLQNLSYNDTCLNSGNHSCKGNDCCVEWKDVDNLWYYVRTLSNSTKEVCVYRKYNFGKKELCFIKIAD